MTTPDRCRGAASVFEDTADTEGIAVDRIAVGHTVVGHTAAADTAVGRIAVADTADFGDTAGNS